MVPKTQSKLSSPLASSLENLGSTLRQHTQAATIKAKAALPSIDQMQKKITGTTSPSKKYSFSKNVNGKDFVKTGSPEKPLSPKLKNLKQSSSPMRIDMATKNFENEFCEEISKEDLIGLVSKMNKRVKTINAALVTLSDRLQTVENEKVRLTNLIENEILNHQDIEEAESVLKSKAKESMEKETITDGNLSAEKSKKNKNDFIVDKIEVLQHAWRATDERKNVVLQHLQNEFKGATIKVENEMEKLKQHHNLELMKIQSNLNERNRKVQIAGSDIKEIVKADTARYEKAFEKVRKFIKIQDQKYEKSLKELNLKHESDVKRIRKERSELQSLRKEMKGICQSKIAGSFSLVSNGHNESDTISLENTHVESVPVDNDNITIPIFHVDEDICLRTAAEKDSELACKLLDATHSQSSTPNSKRKRKTGSEDIFSIKMRKKDKLAKIRLLLFDQFQKTPLNQKLYLVIMFHEYAEQEFKSKIVNSSQKYIISELPFHSNEENFGSIVKKEIIQRNQSLYGNNVIPPDEKKYAFWIYMHYPAMDHTKNEKFSEQELKEMEDSIVDSLLISEGAFLSHPKPKPKPRKKAADRKAMKQKVSRRKLARLHKQRTASKKENSFTKMFFGNFWSK